MMRFTDDTVQPITRINVTPIIDVSLVMVIILLVTAPLLTVADLPIQLPAAHTREAEDERNLSITVSAAGDLAVDERLVAWSALESALRARLAEPSMKDVLVVVRVDSARPYSEVRRTLDVARAAGARRLAIATRQKTRGDL